MVFKRETAKSAQGPEAVWIGAYRSRSGNSVGYVFIAGLREYLGNTLPWTDMPQCLVLTNQKEEDADLVSLRRTPGIWAEEMGLHVNRVGRLERRAGIGHIIYELFEGAEHASALSYYPREALGMYRAKRIPYFLESIAVHDLIKQDVSFISQTHHALEPRERQLARVGLPLNSRILAQEWLEHMGLGMRLHVIDLKIEAARLRRDAIKPVYPTSRNGLVGVLRDHGLRTA